MRVLIETGTTPLTRSVAHSSGVDDRVPGQVDPVCLDALGQEVLNAAWRGAEVQLRERGDETAVDLLGERRAHVARRRPASTWATGTPS